MRTNKSRVLVAMSGGVDSSLAAVLLQERGYECIGVTMHLYDHGDYYSPENRGCCSLATVEDARKVAGELGIPYYVLNYRDLFGKTVIDNFVAEYNRGRTPNPCIMCNKHLKFMALMQKARELDAEYLATGHYARVCHNPASGRYELLTAADHNKDQSYALYNITQDVLGRFLLPLGEYSKTEVRQMAAARGLAVADKPDSQEICFVPDNDYRRFLREKAHITPQPGWFVDVSGRRLARHEGLQFYTVGQRKGLGLALGKPAYVVEIRPETAEVVIGDDSSVYAREFVVEDINWVAIDGGAPVLHAGVKVRYSSTPQPAELYCNEPGKAVVRFSEPQRAITPGQSAVFYDESRVLGGGIIERVLR